MTNTAINNHNTFINGLFGIVNSDFFNYFPAEIPADTWQAIERLNDSRYIVTSNVLRGKFDLNIGDTLVLQLENGVFDFKIIGFLDSNWGIGHLGFISSENYINATGELNYSQFYVRADGDPNTVKNNILRSLSRDVMSISTIQELEAANADKVIGIFDSINTYAYFAMLIGIIGIINNMVVCFLSRQRNLALYRCVGMSAKSAGRMLMTEAAAVGIIGTAAGLATGVLLMQAIPLTIGAIWGNLAVAVPFYKIIFMCAAGIAVMLICSIIPFIKGKNISIMDNIRYE
jgi:putative ABC transport system permease protein